MGTELETTRLGRGRVRFVVAITGIAIISALVAILLWPSESPPQYTTEAVTRRNLSITITATGQLAPVNEVDVGSELSGTIKKVDVDFNEHVSAGQVLATLDTQELDAQAVQQQAALKVATAKVDQARATLKEAQLKQSRIDDLVKRKLASQQDLDVANAALLRARADVNGAIAQVAQAKASLDVVSAKLAKSVIRAPINGIILNRNVEPGQTVAATFNTPVLFSLAEDLRRMELHVDVDEADVGHLKEGQTGTFTVDTWPGRIFPAKVTQVRFAPQTVEGVVTYETLLSVDNTDLSLRPGMTATAEVTVASITDALTVPNAALRFTPPTAASERSGGSVFTMLIPRHQHPRPAQAGQGSQGTVWLLKEKTPVAVTVETGMTDGRYTAITSANLPEGTKVITGQQGG